MPSPDLVIFGGGNMGGAIARAIGMRRVVGRVTIVEPDEAKHAALLPHAECAASALEASKAMEGDDALLIAVKPQSFAALAEHLRSLRLCAGRCVISIMAGVSCERLSRELPGARVVRAMPNLALGVGQGISAICAGPHATREDISLARAILGAAGRVVELPENLMDAFTGVAGSGPAYVFLLAEAMIEGARGVGIDEAEADAIVRQTILGAAMMLAQDPRPAGVLRASVTSKGGTTQAALTVLAEAEFTDAFVRAIAAARDRGRALGS